MGRNRNNFKSRERAVAKLLDCVRNPITGRASTPAADVMNDWLVVECKDREKLPLWLSKALRQADAAKAYHEGIDGKERTPIVVLTEARTDVRDGFVLMRMGTWLDLHGPDAVGPDDGVVAFGAGMLDEPTV